MGDDLVIYLVQHCRQYESEFDTLAKYITIDIRTAISGMLGFQSVAAENLPKLV